MEDLPVVVYRRWLGLHPGAGVKRLRLQALAVHRPEHGHPRLVLADQAWLGWWTERNIYSLVTSSAKLFSYQTEKPPAGLLHKLSQNWLW